LENLMKKQALKAAQLLPSFFAVGLALHFSTHEQPQVATGWILVALVYACGLLLVPWKSVWVSNLRVASSGTKPPRLYLHFAQMRSWFISHAVVTGKSLQQHSSAAGKEVWQNIKNNTWLWLGVISTALTFGLLVRAYPELDDHYTHLGLIAGAVSAIFFIAHFGGWGKVLDTVEKHPMRVWLLLSIISFVVTLGHALILRDEMLWWYAAGISLVSLITAAITVADGWGTLGGLASKGTGKLARVLFGEKGRATAFLTWSAVFFAITAMLMLVWYYIGLSEDLWYLMAASLALSMVMLCVGIAIALKGGTDRFGKTIGFTD
jgi:hypothetical protein